MDEAINDAISAAIDGYIDELSIDERAFEIKLAEHGFMIVPIEDPTNLFRVMEDSL